MNRRKFVTALASFPALAIPAAAIAASSKSSSIVTELVIDARGVAVGSEHAVRAMRAADAAFIRVLEKDGYIARPTDLRLDIRALRREVRTMTADLSRLRASAGKS